jgi:hypothetical protein
MQFQRFAKISRTIVGGDDVNADSRVEVGGSQGTLPRKVISV